MEAVIGNSCYQPRTEVVTSDINPTSCHDDNSLGDPWYKGPLKVYMRRKYKPHVEAPLEISKHSSPAFSRYG